MTREDIIRMAREAGCLLPGQGGDPNGLWEPNGWENVTDLMFKFAELVAAHEREECAQFLESTDLSGLGNDIKLQVWFGKMFMGFAEAIRARGEK